MHKGIRFVITCCLFFYCISIVQAYTFTKDFEAGIFWGEFPIIMSLYVADEQEATLLASLVQEAKEEWEDVLGVSYLWSFSEVKFSSNFSGSHIRWSDNFAEETGYDPESVLAVTVRHNNGFLFQRVEIILNSGRADLRNNTNGLLKKTIIHELGHTLGLGHSEEGIMHPYIGSITHLLDDDVAGVLAVIDETIRRQQMILTDDRRQQVATCGTIGVINNGDGNSNFIYSWLVGFLMLFAVSFKRVFKLANSFVLKNQ